jgi:hypothetical protein
VNRIAKVGKTLALLVVLAMVAIGAGLVIAWYMGNHDTVSAVALAPETPVSQPPESAPPTVTPPKGPGLGSVLPPLPPVWTNPVTPADSLPWGQRLDEILLRGGEPSDKADMITNLMRVAPPEAQVELAQHLINMAQDDHYDGTAGLLTNAATPAAVSTVLMNDLLNRRNNLKLPMLLAIARNDDHPLKDQARDMLELFLQADYSTNWDQWAAAVDAWLQQNQ